MKNKYVDIPLIYEYPRQPLDLVIWNSKTACIVKCNNPNKQESEDWIYSLECNGIIYEITDSELNNSNRDYSIELSNEYDWVYQ